MRGNFTRKVRGIIAILLLMVLSACSKYFVSTATDDNLPEADVIANAKVETALEKYVNFNLNGEKGTLVQFGIETGIEYEKEEQYTPLLASGILINTPKIEEKFPSKVELVVKETIATNGNNNIENHDSTHGVEETAHYSACGSLDMVKMVKAYHDLGYAKYIRPDHGRMIWDEDAKPGYGLYDRALGAMYINGIWETLDKIDGKKD